MDWNGLERIGMERTGTAVTEWIGMDRSGLDRTGAEGLERVFTLLQGENNG